MGLEGFGPAAVRLRVSSADLILVFSLPFLPAPPPLNISRHDRAQFEPQGGSEYKIRTVKDYVVACEAYTGVKNSESSGYTDADEVSTCTHLFPLLSFLHLVLTLCAVCVCVCGEVSLLRRFVSVYSVVLTVVRVACAVCQIV